MIFDVQISEQAERDLREIYTYIAFELLAPENAAGQIDRLEAAISQLNRMPDRYKKYSREPWRSLGLRLLPVGRFLVFYIPNIDTKVVTVLRVMYSGRDIDKELKRKTDGIIG